MAEKILQEIVRDEVRISMRALGLSNNPAGHLYQEVWRLYDNVISAGGDLRAVTVGLSVEAPRREDG